MIRKQKQIKQNHTSLDFRLNDANKNEKLINYFIGKKKTNKIRRICFRISIILNIYIYRINIRFLLNLLL